LPVAIDYSDRFARLPANRNDVESWIQNRADEKRQVIAAEEWRSVQLEEKQNEQRSRSPSRSCSSMLVVDWRPTIQSALTHRYRDTCRQHRSSRLYMDSFVLQPEIVHRRPRP
jgi:hypothetical protein